MNSLNSILIEGNLVKDPLLRSTPKGTQVCAMRLASNRFYKQNNNDLDFEKEVSFFDVEAWAKLAESCYSKGKKGRGVRIVGRLKEDRWNGSDGRVHSRVTIVAEHVEFRPEFRRDTQTAAGNVKSEFAAIAAEPELYNNEAEPYVTAEEMKEFEAVTF